MPPKTEERYFCIHRSRILCWFRRLPSLLLFLPQRFHQQRTRCRPLSQRSSGPLSVGKGAAAAPPRPVTTGRGGTPCEREQPEKCFGRAGPDVSMPHLVTRARVCFGSHLLPPLPSSLPPDYALRFGYDGRRNARCLPLFLDFRNTCAESAPPCPLLRTLARIRLPPTTRGPPREIGKIHQNTNLPTYLYSKKIKKTIKT